MGFRIENNCVGPCPMGCIHCGRSREHIYYCDECDFECDIENDDLYRIDGKELCFECVKNSLTEIACDDMDSERCADCKGEVDTLYKFDGELLCEECLKRRLDDDYRVDFS